MIKIKFNRRLAILSLAVVFLGGAVGLAVYELQELKGLRARVHSVENYLYVPQAIAMNEAQKVDYQVLSRKIKNIRVEDTSDYESYQEERKYTAQKLYVYRMRITNNTPNPYDYTDGDIRGKTASGTLIGTVSVYSIHPDDKEGKGLATLSLAPGGSSEIYIYIPADEEIVDLYNPYYYSP